jgi:alkanesulfonate monooxygenase SsuD/methylene tetrahydromethanopterin reductase-like flavin-dependent oxidoreductase (luciferase family)
MARNPRHLHLNASLPVPGLDVDSYIELARTAERGLLDSVSVDDSLAVWWQPGTTDTAAGGLEPLTLLSAVATATEHIGLIATASTTFYEPYLLARAFASLDHISYGRAGWTIVTSASLREANNFSLDEQVEQSVRHERAAELLDVVTQLWDSWADDARQVREIEHTGLFFKVRGPLNVPRTPQGWPLLAQRVGSSAEDVKFAARYAETVFSERQTLSTAVTFAREVKARAAAYGREAHVPVVLPGIIPIIGSTDAEARRLQIEHDAVRSDYGHGHRVLVGTPERIVDSMQEWADAGAADGFNILPPPYPDGLSGLTTFVDQVVPLLQRRDLFRTEYDNSTLRERFGLPRPEDHFLAPYPAANPHTFPQPATQPTFAAA